MEKFKFSFEYTDKKILEEQLLSIEYTVEIVNGVYKYSYDDKAIADISIVKDRLLVINYSRVEYFNLMLKKMITKYYDNVIVTDNIPYILEKFGLTKEWLEFKLLSKDELLEEYIQSIEFCSYNEEHIQIKYIERWLKGIRRWLKYEHYLDDASFDFLLPYIKKFKNLIKTMPLSQRQLQILEKLAKNDLGIENQLLHRRVFNGTLSQELLNEVLDNNDINIVKAFINRTNNDDYLNKILEDNRLESDKVNNIIRKKIGLKKVYSSKGKAERKAKLNPSVRVHVLTAMESSTSLIIRRGPSKKMCTILWDREKNSFEAGDCIPRIEERLSDISPDGKYFYYFGWTLKGAWLAIAKTDSLRNMIFYRESGFRSRDVPSSHPEYVYELYKYFMENRPYGDSNPNNTFPRFKCVERKFEKEDWDICNITAVYYRRLIRDGWMIVQHEGKHHDQYACNYATHFEKELVGDWSIRKIAYDVHPAPENTNGGHWDAHQVINKRSDKVYDFPDWDWAERDEVYLYFTQKGILYRVSLVSLSAGTLKEITSNAELLCDLNSFNIPFKKGDFNLDGDVDVLRGLRHEENSPVDYDAVEYHYLNSIENGGVDACFYLAQVYLNKKDSPKKALPFAEKGFERATKKRQLTYWHHEYYGHILFKNKYYKKAFKIFEASLDYTTEDKNKAVSYNYLGVISRLQKEDTMSLVFFKKAVALDDSIDFYQENILKENK